MLNCTSGKTGTASQTSCCNAPSFRGWRLTNCGHLLYNFEKMEQVKLHESLLNGQCVFAECSWESVKHLFLNYHYLKRMPAGILSVYGLFDESNLGEAVGGAVFCNGRIQYEGKFIEFSRMWMHPRYGKNTESWFMAKCMKALKKKFKNYIGVVTWADPKRGHTGTIYLAANFVYDGNSRVVKKYIGKNNRTIYQRTATKEHICIGVDEPKRRFIYYFRAKDRPFAK